AELAAMDVTLQCDGVRTRRRPVGAEPTAPRIPIVIGSDVSRGIHGRAKVEVFSVSSVVSIFVQLATVAEICCASLFASAFRSHEYRLSRSRRFGDDIDH